MWDSETIFSEQQTLTDGAISVNVVDTGGGDAGTGYQPVLQVAVGSGVSGDLTVQVKTSAQSSMTAAETIAEFLVDSSRLEQGGVVLAAALPTGCKRYLRLAYAGATGGTVTAGLVAAAQTSQFR